MEPLNAFCGLVIAVGVSAAFLRLLRTLRNSGTSSSSSSFPDYGLNMLLLFGTGFSSGLETISAYLMVAFRILSGVTSFKFYTYFYAAVGSYSLATLGVVSTGLSFRFANAALRSCFFSSARSLGFFRLVSCSARRFLRLSFSLVAIPAGIADALGT